MVKNLYPTLLVRHSFLFIHCTLLPSRAHIWKNHEISESLVLASWDSPFLHWFLNGCPGSPLQGTTHICALNQTFLTWCQRPYAKQKERVCVCVLGEWCCVCVCVCVWGRIAHNWNTFSNTSITKSWFKATILVLFCSIFQSHVSCFYLSEPYLSNICRHVKWEVAISTEGKRGLCEGTWTQLELECECCSYISGHRRLAWNL